MILKLRNRLIGTIMLFISIIMFVAFIAIFAIVFIRIKAENMEKITREETLEIVSLEESVVIDSTEVSNAVVVNRISPSLGIYFNLITDRDGNLQYIDSALKLNDEIYEMANDIAHENPGGGTVEIEGRRWQYHSVQAITMFGGYSAPLQNKHILVRFLDVTDSYKTLVTLAYTLVVLYCVFVIVFFILAWYFANRLVRPIAKTWESQRQFIADASHELKTPISTLNTTLDVLYDSREDTIKNQIKWLDNSKKVLGRMTTLINDMLELARVDELSETLQQEQIDVKKMVEGVVDYFEPLAREKQIMTIENIGASIYVNTNYNLLQQAMEILMDNAIKYTNDNGQIEVEAYSNRNDVIICVHNTGVGISATDIGNIFDRFYRGDKSRVYSDDSYGLGLSIAKSAVQRLGGEISVKSDSMKTSFIVKIPNTRSRRA